MAGIARRTDERGYPKPLSEPVRRRLATAAVVVGTAAGGAIWLWIGVGASLVWWGVVLDVAVSVIPGLVVGVVFGSRERDVAVPTWAAAGLAAFAVAALVPLIVLTLVVMIGMAVTHTGEWVPASEVRSAQMSRLRAARKIAIAAVASAKPIRIATCPSAEWESHRGTGNRC